MEAKITFIRHGETDGNVQQLVNGVTGQDTPLSVRGQDEAKKAGEKLKDEIFTGVYTSNTVRTQHTANLMLKENAHEKDTTRIQRWEILGERNFGVMDGQPTSVLLKEIGRLGLRSRKEMLGKYDPEGGETMEDLRKRTRKIIEELLKEAFDQKPPSQSPNLLVVTHGHTLFELVRCLAEDYSCKMPCEEEVYGATLHTNTGMTRVVFRKDEGGEVEAECTKFNGSDHLTETTSHYNIK